MRFRHYLATALLAAAFVLGGCRTHDPDDSSIPWNRPAQWEDQPPGMGF